MAVPNLHLESVSGNISLREVSTVNPPETDQSSTPVSSQLSMPSTVVAAVSGNISLREVSTANPPETDQSSTPVSSQLSMPSTVVAGVKSPTRIIAEHSYCKQPSKIQKPKNTKYEESAPPLIRGQLQTSRRKLRNLQSELNRLRKKSHHFKTRLANALQMSKDRCLLKLTENMTSAAKIFTKMQSMQSSKKSKGRRFSLEEKVLSLSMYKKSPKCYTLLSTYFTLPSAKSLKRLLAQVNIEAGLNKAIFLKLKETVKHLDVQDRLCCLLFDEMSITPQIHYDAAKDKLRGFAWRSKIFADHVLVYMIKGIRKNFKQPLAYYFTNCLKKSSLKEITLSVIKYVQGQYPVHIG